MDEAFERILAVGGKTNSLGRAADVINEVLNNKSRLEELYQVIFHEDSWIRMRAVDSFEKVARVHPEWIEPYINRIQSDLSQSTQASIQWHIAQIYTQVTLDDQQRKLAIQWLEERLRDADIDWIVAANAMKALVYFVSNKYYEKSYLIKLLKVQLGHKSPAVVKRAQKLLIELS
jgi:hypothetical protein